MNLADFHQVLLENIVIAGSLSWDYRRESGFCGFSGGDFLEVTFNKPVLGEVSSISNHLTPFSNHVAGEGFAVPEYHASLVDVHFHPPKSSVFPSYSDLAVYNKNLSSCERMGFEVWRGEYSVVDKVLFCDEKLFYPHPVNLIGRALDTLYFEVLVFQSVSPDPGFLGSFNDYVSDYCKQTYGIRNYELGEFHYMLLGYPVRLKKASSVAKFLVDSGLFKAEAITVVNGKLSARDIDKLGSFDLLYSVND